MECACQQAALQCQVKINLDNDCLSSGMDSCEISQKKENKAIQHLSSTSQRRHCKPIVTIATVVGIAACWPYREFITHQEFKMSQEFENVNFPSRFLSTVYEIFLKVYNYY